MIKWRIKFDSWSQIVIVNDEINKKIWENIMKWKHEINKREKTKIKNEEI